MPGVPPLESITTNSAIAIHYIHSRSNDIHTDRAVGMV